MLVGTLVVVQSLAFGSLVAAYGPWASVAAYLAIAPVWAVVVLARRSSARSVGGAPAAPSAPPTDGAAAAARAQSRYGVLVGASGALGWATFVVVDALFFGQLARQHADPAAITAVVSGFLLVAGVLWLGGVIVARRLLRRVGLAVALQVTPLLALAALAALAAAAALGSPEGVLAWLAAAARLVTVALGLSLGIAAIAAAHRATPGPQGPEPASLVPPLAVAATAGGLLALASVGGFEVVTLAAIAAALALGWAATSFALGRDYPKLASAAVGRRRWGADGAVEIDSTGIALLKDHLTSSHPAAVIYALERLGEHGVALTNEDLSALLRHAIVEVRGAALRWVEAFGAPGAGPILTAHLANEAVPTLRAATLRALAAVGDPTAGAVLVASLDDPEPVVRAGAGIALLRHGERVGEVAGRKALQRLAESGEAHERVVAAQALGAGGLPDAHVALRVLLDDPDAGVRRAAVDAAGEVRHPDLWPAVIRAGDAPGSWHLVQRALAGGGDEALDAIESALADPDLPVSMVVMLVRSCGRIGSPRAARAIESCLDVPVARVRSTVLQALAACGYRSAEPAPVQAGVRACTERLQWLDETLMTLAGVPPAPLLAAALHDAWREEQDMILLLLTQIGDRDAILAARSELPRGGRLRTEQALALAGAGLTLELRQLALPWLEAAPDAERAAERTIDGKRPFLATRLEALIAGPEATWFGPWPSACALHAVGSLGLPVALAVLEAAEDAADPLIAGTARWARLERDGGDLRRDGDVLSRLERVLILKTVQIFAGTPDAVLADVADVLDEVEVEAGAAIIRQGDPGDSMYIVVDGKVGVHDGERTLDTLGEREAFGEMALLDPEPRVASVTALEATRLLRLPQAPFHELLHDRPEIAIAIMRVLAQRLRDRIRDLAAVRAGGSGGAPA